MRICIAVALFIVGTITSWGQAATAASTAVQGIRIQSYGLASYQQPNFGNYGRSQTGGTLGSDLNIFHFGRFQPSLDARVSANLGSVNTLFFGGGPRLVLDAGRFHPYVNFLAGYGVARFTTGTPYTHDNSFVTSLGGGVDFALNNRWAVRADVQRQKWNVDSRSPNFYPVQIGVGIRYQFHLRNRNGPE